MLAGVVEASKKVTFGVAGVGVCEEKMCTECAFITPRQVTRVRFLRIS